MATTDKATLPSKVRRAITEIRKDFSMNAGMKGMSERADEFPSELAAQLTGIALHPPSRAHMERAMDNHWATAKLPTAAPELVVGAGLHAAIYCAVRVAMGHPKPVVIERTDRVGGAFAVSENATFYLNSRNRPGDLGLPGRGEALNVLPGAPIQPAHLSGEEYQRNSDLAFVIRVTLAMYAHVVTGMSPVAGFPLVATPISLVNRRRQIAVGRMIYATGLGEPIGVSATTEQNLDTGLAAGRVFTFERFMKRMGSEAFPLRGMKRVAVIGSGDSGRAAIEALTGQGPPPAMSTAALDWPEQIDWYGVPSEAITRAGWERCNRSRYKGIGRLLPREQRVPSRVLALEAKAARVGVGYEGVYVNGRRYTHLVWCVGYKQREEVTSFSEKFVSQRRVGREIGPDVFAVGPYADLPLAGEETQLGLDAVPENSTALFRYADRTATLAASLGTARQPTGTAGQGVIKKPGVTVEIDTAALAVPTPDVPF